jgi:hypothetical protein
MDREALHRGIGRTGSEADPLLGVIPAERKAAPMSADDLKRKIRNFPAANLNQRIAATV